MTIVLETARPARIDNYADASGPLGVAARESGLRSAVGTPILVEGRLWGVMIAGSTREQPLPADTEARLGLVHRAGGDGDRECGEPRRARPAGRGAGGVAAGRDAGGARGAAGGGVRGGHARRSGGCFPVDFADMGRYEPDGTVTVVARLGQSRATTFPSAAGGRLGGRTSCTIVFETGRSARIDSYRRCLRPDRRRRPRDRVSARRSATPIIVDGRLWGVMIAGSTPEQPLPADTEARLASFTELVATAIANAESRAGLARLAEEQAALRRVATLVARGAPPEEVFAAVTEEVGRLLPVDFAHMGRYEPDGTLTFVATSGSTAEHFPVGSRWSLGGKNLATIVFETGRPARIDSYGDASGPLGVTGRELGIRSSVGTPIIVEGRSVGRLIAGSTREEPLPRGHRGAPGARSPNWWRRRSRTPRAAPLWPRRARGSSRPRMRAGGGSSAICTTGRSSAWCMR